MKRIPIFALCTSLLVSCQSDLSSGFEKDKTAFLMREEFTDSYSEHFQCDLHSKKEEDSYTYALIFSSPKEEYEEVRVLFSPGEEYIYPFGYDSDYKWALSGFDLENNIIEGISLSFSSTIVVESIKCFFSCTSFTLYFTIGG